MKDYLTTLMSIHSGQPKERLSKDMERDFYMSADEAKAYGIVDSVLVPRIGERGVPMPPMQGGEAGFKA
jgi:ATP-dependent Clp protease protease subunit